MKLVSDIINELIDSEKSLTAPLLKTKVLATRIKNDELLKWVNNELGGYSTGSELPSYRKSEGNLTGNCIQGNYQYNNQPLATIGLPDGLREALHDMSFYQGVSTLESMNSENKSGRLEKTISPELTELMAQNIRKMGNPFFNILSAKCTISVSQVTQVLGSVRSQLLDFMLKLDEEFGTITEIEDLKTKNQQITKFMSQTIINKGDGNVINTGDKAEIKASINIQKGDFESLRKHLSELGIQSQDIDELKAVIDVDQPDLGKGTFGQSVNHWIQKMFGKALDGAWQVSTGAAGTLLAEAVKTYYGM